jgi:hypothetical protein
MLNVVMLSVTYKPFMLSVIMLTVIMLSVIMLNVVTLVSRRRFLFKVASSLSAGSLLSLIVLQTLFVNEEKMSPWRQGYKTFLLHHWRSGQIS